MFETLLALLNALAVPLGRCLDVRDGNTDVIKDVIHSLNARSVGCRLAFGALVGADILEPCWNLSSNMNFPLRWRCRMAIMISRRLEWTGQ